MTMEHLSFLPELAQSPRAMRLQPEQSTPPCHHADTSPNFAPAVHPLRKREQDKGSGIPPRKRQRASTMDSLSKHSKQHTRCGLICLSSKFPLPDCSCQRTGACLEKESIPPRKLRKTLATGHASIDDSLFGDAAAAMQCAVQSDWYLDCPYFDVPGDEQKHHMDRLSMWNGSAKEIYYGETTPWSRDPDKHLEEDPDYVMYNFQEFDFHDYSLQAPVRFYPSLAGLSSRCFGCLRRIRTAKIDCPAP